MSISKIRPSVWDDSEPDYAPGLKMIRGKPKWVCPEKYRQAGYAIKTYALEPEAHPHDLARVCRVLTREVLLWWDGEVQKRPKQGTWGWLAQRYIHDDYSAIHDVRPQTKADYITSLDRITAAIGEVRILETDYATMSEWKRVMEKKGRSVHYIKKWFTHFRLIVSHGVRIREPGCAEVMAIRSEMRIKNPAPRYQTITRDQIVAVVAEADKRGHGWLALSLLLRFELALRGVDVYGQWAPDDGSEGGIRRKGRKWEGGITWDMIDAGVTTLTKVISKTRDSLPEPYAWDLTLLPEIRQRLLSVPVEKRVGPVIVTRNGLPPLNLHPNKTFKAIVRALGLPDDLRISDARSGAATEAKAADPYLLRDAMQHTQAATTDRYTRGRSAAANKVIQMRRTDR